jgi:hypothetical protein
VISSKGLGGGTIYSSICERDRSVSTQRPATTKGLTLEQVDRMFEETTPRKSSRWHPHSTYAQDLGLTKDGLHDEHKEDVDKRAFEQVAV